MSVRVNLLRPEEIRHPGAIEKANLIRLGVVLGLSAVVVAGVWGVFQYQAVVRGHARVKAGWAAIEPEYLRVKQVLDAHNSNRKYLDELNGWSTSRIDWTEPFEELQRLVPANIQLTRMSVLGEIAISEAKPATKENPGTPARRYQWKLEGRALGEMSDQDVIQFVDALRRGESFQDWLASVKLQGLQRTQSRPDQETDERAFRVDASSHERLIQ
jgi:hypothetical protein